ncbi:MAG: hypothetical protein IPJ77_07720 [Planctomycetes bacterium]|nr:hypothetical protein [Planctomycetota bacterium]
MIGQSETDDLLDVLVTEGALSPPAAERVRARAREAWLPLGKILRQQGALTSEQLLELLDLQATRQGARFGELALERGFVTEDALERALALQRELSPHLLELVVHEPELDRERLVPAVVRYLRLIEAQRNVRTERALGVG